MQTQILMKIFQATIFKVYKSLEAAPVSDINMQM